MRFIWWLVALPVGVVLIALSIANRHLVELFTGIPLPFLDSQSLNIPLFVLLFVCLIAGFLLGATSMWLNQHHWRRDARRARKEADRWHAEADRRQMIVDDDKADKMKQIAAQ